MKGLEKKDKSRKKNTEINTFPVPMALAEVKKIISISTNTVNKTDKEEIVSLIKAN